MTVIEELTRLNRLVNDSEQCLKTMRRMNQSHAGMVNESEISQVASDLAKVTKERDWLEGAVIRQSRLPNHLINPATCRICSGVISIKNDDMR